MDFDGKDNMNSSENKENSYESKPVDNAYYGYTSEGPGEQVSNYNQDVYRSTGPEMNSGNIDSYKENIRNMKAELKRIKKEEKARSKLPDIPNIPNDGSAVIYKKGVGGGALTGIVVACIAIGCAISLFLVTSFPNQEDSLLATLVKKYGNTETTIIQEKESGTININNENISIAQAVYAKASPSVVGIRVVSKATSFWDQQQQTVHSEGSGVVYSSDGLIVTNHHVVQSAINDGKLQSNYEIRIYMDKDLTKYYTAELLGYDEDTDLALLKIDVTGLTPIELADYKDITIGEPAIAIGSPGGLDYMNSISEGIVSGIDRDISTDTGTSLALIQTTAAINPGNSGGALLNSKGQLIGICVIKIASTEYEGMGFAINSDTIKSVVEMIQESGTVERPKLGVSIRTDYSSDIAGQQGYPEGAYIAEVNSDSCADKAGIKSHDIIVKFGNEDVKSFNDLKRALNKHKVGDVVELQVYRISEGKNISITVTLEK